MVQIHPHLSKKTSSRRDLCLLGLPKTDSSCSASRQPGTCLTLHFMPAFQHGARAAWVCMILRLFRSMPGSVMIEKQAPADGKGAIASNLVFFQQSPEEGGNGGKPKILFLGSEWQNWRRGDSLDRQACPGMHPIGMPKKPC